MNFHNVDYGFGLVTNFRNVDYGFGLDDPPVEGIPVMLITGFIHNQLFKARGSVMMATRKFVCFGRRKQPRLAEV